MYLDIVKQKLVAKGYYLIYYEWFSWLISLMEPIMILLFVVVYGFELFGWSKSKPSSNNRDTRHLEDILVVREKSYSWFSRSSLCLIQHAFWRFGLQIKALISQWGGVILNELPRSTYKWISEGCHAVGLLVQIWPGIDPSSTQAGPRPDPLPHGQQARAKTDLHPRGCGSKLLGTWLL